MGVRYARPAYPVASAEDFDLPANHHLVCLSPQELWREYLVGEKAKRLLTCLNTLDHDVDYLYVAKTQPELALEQQDSETKSCLSKLMPTLPLPREIYFLALTGTHKSQDVYSMSFDTTTTSTHRVEFKFPLKLHLENVQDLEFWFVTSVFGLFETDDKMLASLVPGLITEQCFAPDKRFEDKKLDKISPAYWP